MGRPKGSKNKTNNSNEDKNKTAPALQREIIKKYTFDDFKKAFGIETDLEREELTKILEKPYKCCCCGKHYAKQKGNFPASTSRFFIHNNLYLPICYNCLENHLREYMAVLGSEQAAMERICLHWDMYWNPEIFESSSKARNSESMSVLKSYVRRIGLIQYKDKSYDTTIDALEKVKINSITEIEDFSEFNEDYQVSEDTIKFFGLGYSKDEYQILEDEYNDWVERYECQTKAQEELFKNLSITQLKIQQITKEGGDIDKLMATFNKLLDNANISPRRLDDSTSKDDECFGTLIKKWEYEKPIPEPDPEWKDVDGIVKYITVYFLGHLCKMLHIKNSYSRMYDEEMEKYRVERPEYEDDDEALFDSIFCSASNSLNGDDDDKD